MIEAHQVSKRFGSFQALYPTNILVPEKSFTAILGPSGSGKTTLLRIIAGLEQTDTGMVQLGSLLVNSTDNGVFLPPEKRGIGMVFQDFALWPHMTVFENIAFGLRARKLHRGITEKVLLSIEKVSLQGKEQRYPHELSGGEQQRVAFARAIVTEPRVILLDEPLSALDAILREHMRLELKSLVHELGLTALYVTHDQHEALSMADQVVIMNMGRILQIGPPEEVYSNPAHPFVASFLGRSNWFPDKERMVRPEHLYWEPEHDEHFSIKGTVTEIGYLGDRYEVVVRIENEDPSLVHHWTAYRPTPIARGEKVELYLHQNSVTHLTQKE